MLIKLLKILFLKTFIWEYLIIIKNKFNLIYGKYYAQNGIDLILEEYINYKDGFFIEIGANDGVRQSNTLYLEKFKNWRGILIEPSKRYKNLKKNRNFFFFTMLHVVLSKIRIRLNIYIMQIYTLYQKIKLMNKI